MKAYEDAVMETTVEGREVWLECSTTGKTPAPTVLADMLRVIADTIEKDGRIYDVIYLGWIKP